MIFRVLALILAGLSTLTLLPAYAQGLRPASRSPVTLPVAVPEVPGAQRPADFIVSVVNSEPITNYEVTIEVRRILQQYAQQRRPQPDLGELSSQVLERLINDRAQLQLAKETGIKVDEPSVDQAEQTVARQNQMTVAELRRRMELDGLDPKQLRERLRDQLMLTRLREREVDPRVRVSDLEVEQYLQDQLATSSDPAKQLINMAQLLVAVPEGASEAQVAALQDKARRALVRARAGEDFAALVRELSDAKDKSNGGQLGLRSADRYPTLFLEATRSLAIGAVTDLVRSGAGFHILQLIERRSAGLPPMTVTQSHARHILLVSSAKLSEAAARDKLLDFSKRIQSGQTDFATLARENSQDASAAKGGDLGWANPGQFVPEFEEVINRLAPGQISDPLISRFGVHLIQLLERRNSTLGEREQREMIRNMLREKKFGDVYENWAKEVRARAYVELREAPQ
jgi:peptidyl-prolyl cis-trans isomerase SurA